MYGLKQAAILAYRQLVQHLDSYCYVPVPFLLSLWTHKTLRTKFCLCVDDFGVKFYSKDDAENLINALKKGYPVTVDWDGKNYCGFTLDWQYGKGYANMSMESVFY